jgi:hypothetical protein
MVSEGFEVTETVDVQSFKKIPSPEPGIICL